MAEFAINSAVNRSTGKSPCFLNYGWNPATPVVRELDTAVPAASTFAKSADERLTLARKCLQAVQERASQHYNKRKVDVTFTEGQLVLLSTTNLRKMASVPKGKRKLFPRWVGPFKVVQMVGKAAVQLELPASYRIHNVFHVGLVKLYHASGSVQPPTHTDWLETIAPVFPVERVLDARTHRENRTTVREYLVKWANQRPEYNSWEPESSFPSEMDNELATLRQRVDAAA